MMVGHKMNFDCIFKFRIGPYLEAICNSSGSNAVKVACGTMVAQN